jgi:anti-sigma28 factor (negative regulator of flagellin synthesis)
MRNRTQTKKNKTKEEKKRRWCRYGAGIEHRTMENVIHLDLSNKKFQPLQEIREALIELICQEIIKGLYKHPCSCAKAGVATVTFSICYTHLNHMLVISPE